MQSDRQRLLTLPGEPTNGWLVLMGGGEFSFGETAEVDHFLLSKMPPERRSVAFIPTASGSQEYAVNFRKYVLTLDSTVEVLNVPLFRRRDVRREKNLEMVRSAGLVYLGGGVVEALLDVTRESPLIDAMRVASGEGAVIGAIAASATAFATRVRDTGGAVVTGFDWIPRSAIEAGFEATADAGLRRLMSDPAVDLGIGIPRGAALAIAPDRSGTILGEGTVAIMRKPSAG